ncbi:MAG: hypothetical protein JW784_01390 [Candidatus Cloacimonetes bacterium]|nr:hypothetical protein [Candidatus Cloacimonadota bacterium]
MQGMVLPVSTGKNGFLMISAATACMLQQEVAIQIEFTGRAQKQAIFRDMNL